jgi:hypothetical protein
MFERYRNFCSDLILLLACPCNRPGPIVVLCDPTMPVFRPTVARQRRPQAARRRRSRRTSLGRSADPGGDGDPPSTRILIIPRPPPRSGERLRLPAFPTGNSNDQ